MFFRRPLAHTAVNAIGAYLADLLLVSFVVVGGFWAYIVIGLFIGVLNILVKPILKVISLPVIFLTFGLFLIVINALILWVMEYLLGVFQFGEKRRVFHAEPADLVQKDYPPPGGDLCRQVGKQIGPVIARDGGNRQLPFNLPGELLSLLFRGDARCGREP